MDGTETYRHCPTCGAEYRAGFTICADCGSLLRPGPSPSQEPGERSEPGRADYVGTAAPEVDRDRFAMEETPVVLTSIVEEDADAFLAALEEEEIGARRGEATRDGGVEILVHAANLVDAQAVLVEFTGDIGLVDDIGADDPEQNDMAVVATARLQDAGAQASRLRARGIDVRIELPSDPQAELSPMASILVPWDQLEEARKIIGIEL
ncbi:MAG TPA: hypothetical protein VFA25_07950 [Actinomycetota bacterium]|nr:hypothetical protein [Actinomycetota bacterium]